jgi:hypothetical protein
LSIERERKRERSGARSKYYTGKYADQNIEIPNNFLGLELLIPEFNNCRSFQPFSCSVFINNSFTPHDSVLITHLNIVQSSGGVIRK